MQRWQVGDVIITKIVEMEVVGGTRFILPDALRDAVIGYDWLKPHFMDDAGNLIMSVHALIVETPDRRIVVDTCIGNDKLRLIPGWNDLQTTFLDDMLGAGYAPDSIDTVLCTHLHVDHVGWNTRLVEERWEPTFAGARYLMGRVEYEHWSTQGEDESQAAVMADSVAPVFDAGLVDLVEADHVVSDDVRLVPTYGHTPGHVSVLVSSRGEEALITGDFLHHPCQMARIDWCSSADVDATAAVDTRRRLFEQYADTPTLIIGTHFAGVTAGRLVRDGNAYRLAV
jgi:glyoxylase-like metal-dependent hydrolase (beta-lactamase superfamily II)